MDAAPLSELEVDQLEELARAHYEEVDGRGVCHQGCGDLDRGGRKGKCRVAVQLGHLLSRGNGIAKDANKAFKMMLELANKQPSGYHLAHYAVAVMFFENEGGWRRPLGRPRGRSKAFII